MSHELRFQVSIPTQEGFVGCACANSDCGQYFKVLLADHKDHLHCPYCGVGFHKNSLLTSDQRNYVTEHVREEARQYAVLELQKMLKKVLGSGSARRSGISYKPGRVRKRTVRAQYTERTVDTELDCPTCNTRFQVYGIFGYCPGCREENLRIYDANWAIIQREIENSDNQARALRHGYGDLVSAFEAFCKRKAAQITTETCNFQAVFDARRFFKRQAGVDILAELETSALLSIRRVFQKRHVCVHNNGEITDKYVRLIPEDSGLLGQKVEMRLNELKEAAVAVRLALGVLVKAMERKG